MAMFWKICLIVTLALCSQVFAQFKGTLLGGWRDADENDANVMKAMQYAKEEYNKFTKNGYITDFIKTIRLRKQVVSGMKYSIEVEALVSPCPESEFIAEGCQDQNKTKQRCSFTVVMIPWKKENNLLNSYCKTL